MAGHIAARGAGTWRLFVDGPRDVVTGRRRQITRTFHGSKKQAEKELAHLVVEVERGAHDGRAGTVDQLFAQWLAVAHHEKSTAATNATYYQNYVRPALGSRTVRKLRPLELQKFYRDLIERGGQAGGPLSPNTVRRVHDMLHRALQEAVRWGWIVSNPAHGIDLPKAEERQQRAPTPAEVGTLLAEAASKDPDWAGEGRRKMEIRRRRYHPEGMTSEAAARDTAAAIQERIRELGLTIAELTRRSGVSEPVIRDLRRALVRNYQDRSLSALSQALGWHYGALRAMLSGLEPEPAPSETSGAVPAVQREIDDIVRMLAEGVHLQQEVADRLARLKDAD